MKHHYVPSLALAFLLALGACAPDREAVTGETQSPTPPLRSMPAGDGAIEPGTYRITKSARSVADFTVTFPKGWTVQDHEYQSDSDGANEFGFSEVVVDAIYADACKGDRSELVEVGPSVDDLAAALLQQPGPMLASGPVATNVGGYPATRIDLTIPKGFNQTCGIEGFGLQIWYSQISGYFVLLADGIASVYILDVDGQRQVFLTQYRSATSDEDVRELQAVLDSIHIET
jgi:hypothetical protein